MRVVRFLLLWIPFACVHAQAGTPASPSDNEDDPALPPESDATPPPEPAEAPNGSAPLDVPHPVSQERSDASGPGDAFIPDVAAWFAARGVTRIGGALKSKLGSCTATSVGPSLRDAVLCTGGPPLPGGRPGGQSLYALRVVYADQESARLALQVPIAAGPLYQPGAARFVADDPDRGNYVLLVPRVSSDGKVLTIGERAGGTCADKIAKSRAINAQGELKGTLTPAIQMMQAACRSRGRYVWSGGRFVRQ